MAAEPVNLDMKEKREHKAPEFMAINPFGKVPALSDGGFNLVSARRGRPAGGARARARVGGTA